MEIRTYQDRFCDRIRQTKFTGKPHYHCYIREVIAGFPSKWIKSSKREIEFILQDHLFVENFEQIYRKSEANSETGAIKCVARPLSDSEPCLLIGFKHLPLVIKSQDEIVETKATPVGGWDYGSLENACESVSCEFEPLDVYLGLDHWVGSTEI